MARRGNRVTIEGIDQLRDRLEELAPTILAAAKRAVRDSAVAIREDTRRSVRVDTGNLRDKVAFYPEDDGLRAEVGWRDRSDWYASLHEHGTRRIPAKPALGPATETERGKFPDRVRTEIQRDLS
ncbi:HK97-gp10 family putative phage morphogenesis protein [Streptomyces sp. NPDC000880]